MKFRTIYAAVLLTILALSAACDKAPRLSSEYSTDPNAVLIDASVGALTRSNPLGENQTKFNVGDKISVVHTSANKQVDYTYDGRSWVPEGDDYLVWQTENKNMFRLQYPFIGHQREFGEYFKNQSTLEEMTKSDLMEAKSVEFDKIPDDRRLVAKLERQRSLVTVKIVGFNDEFGADPKITDLKLHLWDGSQGEEIIRVTPYIRDGQGVAQPAGTEGRVGYSYAAIGRNDCDYEFQNMPFITMTVAGKTLTVANPAPMEIGKRYTYELTVGKESVKIAGVTVEDWTAGRIEGKFEAEVDDYSEWDGKKVSSGYTFSGTGTGTDPYLIKSATDLAGLAANVNAGNIYMGKYFKLESNIDLMGHEWMPIGNNDNPFDGIIDGNSKIITNMAITADPSVQSGAGLLGNCSGASVSNVALKNAKIIYGGEAIISAGLICGDFSGTVKNCRVEGSIVTKDGYCGGIIGKIDGSASVSDCEVVIQGETSWGNMGGIVGYCSEKKLTIESCTAKGEINGGNSGFGGIAGYLLGRSVLVKNCTSYVKLGKSEGTTPRVGGLVGSFYYGKAESCTVYGSISFINDSGLVGGMFSEVYDVTLSNLNFSGDIDVTIQGSSAAIWTNIGAFIAWLGGTATTATGCTYKKSGTGDYPTVGKCDDESFDPNTLDINGI